MLNIELFFVKYGTRFILFLLFYIHVASHAVESGEQLRIVGRILMDNVSVHFEYFV